jgi:hypothetical protein
VNGKHDWHYVRWWDGLVLWEGFQYWEVAELRSVLGVTRCFLYCELALIVRSKEGSGLWKMVLGISCSFWMKERLVSLGFQVSGYLVLLVCRVYVRWGWGLKWSGWRGFSVVLIGAGPALQFLQRQGQSIVND